MAAQIGARTIAPVASTHPETANDRLKKTFGAWFWGSIALSAVIHFAVIRFSPQLRAEDLSFAHTEFEAIELPPELKTPSPPEQILRPAVPVVAKVKTVEDVTIAKTTFDENPIDRLSRPSTEAIRIDAEPVFTPYTVAPEVKDPRKAQRIVAALYPRRLKAAGIGGTVIVWVFIDAQGRVKKAQLNTSSGKRSLDRAAVDAARQFEFTPALNRDRKVPVWVSVPITFSSK